MKNIIVDIADMKITDDPDAVLVTYSLGSCLGVAVYDPVLKIGGMIHCMLPLSKIDPIKGANRPYMFVDIGVPTFFQKLFDLGVLKSRAVVRVAGCARVLDHNQLFNIGERNYTVFRKILWKNGMMIAGEDIGEGLSRTLYLDLATGIIRVKSDGVTREI